MRRKHAAVAVRTVAAGVLVALVAAACGSSSSHRTTSAPSSTSARSTSVSSSTTSPGAPSTAPTALVSSDWSTPNATLYNTRDVASQIKQANVKKMKVAWTIRLGGTEGLFGYYANTPIFSPNGKTAYLQDLQSNVWAVNVKTGTIEWRHLFRNVTEGPNGLTLNDGKLYGETSQKAFAMSAATGKLVWITGKLAKPIGSGATFFKYGQGFNFAPQVAGGKVFISTSAQLGGGIAYALDARTGKIVWQFNELKNKADRRPSVVPGGSAGAWNAPLIADGSVYFGIGNPYLSIKEAIDRPERLLYDNSTLDVDPSTGKIRWYYQAVPDDFYDSDMQISPMYVPGAGGAHEVVDASKDGFVYAFNPSTGKLLWRTSVGKHNGHDDDGQLAMEHKLKLKLPYKRWPGTQGGVETNMAYADGTIYVPDVTLYQIRNSMTAIIGTTQKYTQGTGEMDALNAATGKIEWVTKLPSSPYGDATVTNNLVVTTLLNGKVVAFNRANGKIVWETQMSSNAIAGVAIDGNTLVTAAGYPEGKGQVPEMIGYSLTGKGGSATPTGPAPSTGTSTSSSSTAVSVAKGEAVFKQICSACHTLAAAGATGTTGPNLDKLKPSYKLVVHQVTNGGGGMPAFGSSLSKSKIESVAKYVSSVAGKPH